MKRIFTGGAFFFFFLVACFSSCSRSLIDDQLRLGVWASENDLWDEAIFRWKKVLLANPNSAAAHNNLAVAYEKKGLWEEAQKEYELAVKLLPNNTHVKSNFQNFKENMESAKKEKNEKK